jgi:hypothetical protein
MTHAAKPLVVALMLAAATARGGGAPGRSPAPVVVELFTSEGCSDCPAADLLLGKLMASEVTIVGLSEHVDYWDRLGWKDRFSSATLTNRQRDYQRQFNTDSIYTPQMVVDGRIELVGSDARAARRAIDRAAALPHGVVHITIVDLAVGAADRNHHADDAVSLRLDVGDLPNGPRSAGADIVVVVTEDGLRTEVKHGENRGRTLRHAAVVRYMATIGQTDADHTSARVDIPLAPEWQRDHLRVVAFVQEQRRGAILASAAAPLKNAAR